MGFASGADQPQQHHPPGSHSPVPYLFGGLAAILGTIAFALFILACSYCKLSGWTRYDGTGDLENCEGKPRRAGAKVDAPFEEKVVVIMAGEQEPTFLATPVSSRASNLVGGGDDSKMAEDGGDHAKPLVGICDDRKQNHEGRGRNKNVRGEGGRSRNL